MYFLYVSQNGQIAQALYNFFFFYRLCAQGRYYRRCLLLYCWLQAGNVLGKGTASSQHSVTQTGLNLYLKELHKTLTCHIYAAT